MHWIALRALFAPASSASQPTGIARKISSHLCAVHFPFLQDFPCFRAERKENLSFHVPVSAIASDLQLTVLRRTRSRRLSALWCVPVWCAMHAASLNSGPCRRAATVTGGERRLTHASSPDGPGDVTSRGRRAVDETERCALSQRRTLLTRTILLQWHAHGHDGRPWLDIQFSPEPVSRSRTAQTPLGLACARSPAWCNDQLLQASPRL